MLLFIGAGVSKLFDIPDMKGFIDAFDKEPTISSSSVYNAIKETYGTEIDLEILMTILEDLSRSRNDLLKRISPQTTDFLLRRGKELNLYLDEERVKTESKNLIRRIKKIIVDNCHVANSQNQDRIVDTYDRFFEMISTRFGNIIRSGDTKVRHPRDMSICTTNYDRCLESYLGRRQIDFSSGVRQQYGYGVFDVSAIGGSISLLKLHGSIDLFNIDGVIRQRTYGESIGEEVVYYPIEFGGYNHVIESPYLEMFYLFRQRLSAENPWVIIGSSLRDRTICSMMNDVIRLKPKVNQPRALLVNPDETIINRLSDWGFTHLCGRLKQITEKFGSDGVNQRIASVLGEQW